MKVDKETFDSGSQIALQELLIDVAAVVAATELDRARNGNNSEWTHCGIPMTFPAESQVWPTAGII
jgi:hypothetical protein